MSEQFMRDKNGDSFSAKAARNMKATKPLVSLRWRIHEDYEDEVDMLDALRQTCGGNFTADEAKEQILDELREDLLTIDDQCIRLSECNPKMADRYRDQHRHAENEIAKRIYALRLHGVRAD